MDSDRETKPTVRFPVADVEPDVPDGIHESRPLSLAKVQWFVRWMKKWANGSRLVK